MSKFSKALVLGAMAFSAVAFAAPKGKTVKIPAENAKKF